MELGAECPSCGCSVNELHGSDCTIGRCKNHGEQIAFCLGEGGCRPTTYRGFFPGELEARERGWFTDRIDTEGNPQPDLNRVMSELEWNVDTENWC